MSGDGPRCGQCGGIRIAGGDSCLAHAKPEERAAVLKQFSESGNLDVRGATISDALRKEILIAASHDADGYPAFSAARFDGATFESNAMFSGATFKSDARFDRATFKGNAEFDEAIFKEGTRFHEATFEGDAGFGETAFEGDAEFGGATFEGDADFEKATFKRSTSFNMATFQGLARFNKATFKGEAWFNWAAFKDGAGFGKAAFKGVAGFGEATFGNVAGFGEATFNGAAKIGRAIFKSNADFIRATFHGDAGFGETTFKGNTYFNGVTFEGNAEFARATFEGSTEFSWATSKGNVRFTGARFEGDVQVLGPIEAEMLALDGVQFVSAVRIETDAKVLSCCGGRFSGGVRFDVRNAVVRLDDSDLSVASLLTGPSVSGPDGIAGRPKVLSLVGANVAGLTLGNVSLADCRFAGAHNLDKLRLEADTVFGLSPAVAAWERRQVIAEEVAWRAGRRPGYWKSPLWPYPEGQSTPLSPGAIAGLYRTQLSPGAIAGLYRALRKGREDAKDEPGAADFYYGEMEMRRHDQGVGGANRWRGRASRMVLTAYWLASGYGLRAWRSLVALAVVTALFAAAFHFVGFTQPPEPATYWTSLLYAFRSTVSLTDSQVILTAWGSFFQALLRITGPVLLGLTLLALRVRVKR